MAVSPLPGEHTPAPTPGDSNSNNNATASQNTPSSDEYKRTWEKFHELKNRLPECYRESQKLWLEGSRCLSEDILRNEFPTVWSGRSRNFAERGRNVFASGASGASASKSSSSSKKPGPGHYPNEYFLPLGGITYPVEIVRFTIAVLREWCVKEGVEWEERVVF